MPDKQDKQSILKALDGYRLPCDAKELKHAPRDASALANGLSDALNLAFQERSLRNPNIPMEQISAAELLPAARNILDHCVPSDTAPSAPLPPKKPKQIADSATAKPGQGR